MNSAQGQSFCSVLSHKTNVNQIYLHEDKRHLFTVSDDMTLQLWKLPRDWRQNDKIFKQEVETFKKRMKLQNINGDSDSSEDEQNDIAMESDSSSSVDYEQQRVTKTNGKAKVVKERQA